jgi:hypothetical protein
VGNIEMDLRERERMGWCGLDWYGLVYWPVEGSCEHGIEPSGSIKCSVHEGLHNWRLLTKGPAPWVSLSIEIYLWLRFRNKNVKGQYLIVTRN